MNRIFQTLLAATVLLVATPRLVQANSDTPEASGTVVFEAMDSVEVWDKLYLVLKGVQPGQTAAQELLFRFRDTESAERCQKQALMALDRTGRYLLSLARDPNYGSYDCTLIRR
jgi:hypothetical protein